MAAPTTQFSESNGGTPTVTDGITTLAFASVDNNSNVGSLSVNNPIATNSYSFEKWLRVKLTGIATNSVSGFGVYFTAGAITDGGGGSTITPKFATNATYAAPINTVSTVATTACSTDTSAPGTSFTAPANTLNAYSAYITAQLNVAAGAIGGNMTFPANWLNVQYSYS